MPRRRKGLPITGWLNFNKPLTISSSQAVGKARWLFQAQKAGHAGTLDPLATGVLPIAFGEATKVVPMLVDADKVYRFTVQWGRATSTDDAEGEVVKTSEHRPDAAAITGALPDFIGGISQVPPAYSAVKIDGKRAYAMARAGEEVAVQARTVRIHDLTLLANDDDSATLDVHCGKGTYVRSLARDLALALGTVGHVTRLERVRVGPFSLEDAVSLEKLEQSRHKPHLLLPLETVLDDIPALAVSAEDARAIRHGQSIPARGDHDGDCLLTHAGQALAIAQVADARLNPRRVFQRPETHDDKGD